MKNYAVLLLLPAAVAGAWYLSGYVVIAPPQVLAEVPKYGLADLPAVSTERMQRPPVAFSTLPFGTKREQPIAPPPVAPALPAAAAPVPRPVIVLQAVMIDGDLRIAHIDGNVLREGGLVGGLRLSRIEAKRVMLVSLDSGRKTWVSLDGEN
jgi:hypothetical protein